MRRLIVSFWVVLMACPGFAQSPESPEPSTGLEYVLLATAQTSTMQEEMRRVAATGYRFVAVQGGGTVFGGSEVVAVMSRNPEAEGGPTYDYLLLATTRTSTMQKELQGAGAAGYTYAGQTVFPTGLGSKEVVVILERGGCEPEGDAYEYRLLGTRRTSTMHEELNAAAAEGFTLVGMTESQMTFGVTELVSILHRRSEGGASMRVSGIALGSSETTLGIGGTATLTPTVFYCDGTSEPLDYEWIPSDGSYLHLTESGRLTAVAPGSREFTMNYWGYTASVVITVLPR